MSADWGVYIWESGDTYTFDWNMNRPNDNLETQEISTMQKVKGSDGSNIFMTPETKYTKEPFQMYFADTTSGFRTKIQGYIRNQTRVKIITHNSEEFIGKFINMSRVWFSGRDNSFDLQLTFESMD